jgi:diguanylate cyclase (GGDEF)-like protein
LTDGREQGPAGAGPWSRLPAVGPPALVVHLALVCLTGLPLAVWLCWRHPVTGSTDVPLVLALATVLVLGELLPIQVSRRGRQSDEITISSTCALALIIVAPLSVAILAQTLPMVVDDVRSGKHWTRVLFNVGQYALTFTACRAAFCLLGTQDLFRPGRFGHPDLWPALAAGLVFFVVNHGLVGTAVALASGEKVARHLRDETRFQLSVSGLLVCLAPVVLVVLDFSLLLLPLLLLPIAAVHTSAQLATQREHDALHDVLTTLPNRALLHLETQSALDEAARDETGLAVLLIDLDHFKEINDTLGHNVGDLLIVEVARRLVAAAGDDALVARLGGDEFALLARPYTPGGTLRADVLSLVRRLRAALREPITLSGVRLDVQASIGIAYAPEHASTIDELLSRADVALYAAKEDRGGWRTYDPEQDGHSPERLALLGELRDGLERGELVLHFQPKCEARRGELTGAEVLVRWQHPVRGLLMPDDFIPIAENTGLITDLTLQVLDRAVQQACTWLAEGRPLGVAVNVSARHLTDLDLPVRVKEVLDRHGLPAALLTLEVTESTIMADPSRAVHVLDLLRELGVRIAVDDYGTGYSSLAYLKRLRVDELKIDKSFILSMLDDDSDEVIVRSTVELGHNLGLQIVAEGVEDLAIWQRLLPLGCDVVQGFHLSRPLPAAEFRVWWDARRAALLLQDDEAPRVVVLPVDQPDSSATSGSTVRRPC